MPSPHVSTNAPSVSARRAPNSCGKALRDALGRHDEAEMEERHKAGYRRIPPAPDEFAIPDEHRAWGDEEDTKAWVMPRSP